MELGESYLNSLNTTGMFSKNALPVTPSSDAVIDELERLATKYPFLHLFEFGRSVMGRELHCIRMGSGKRRVFFSASHHANEWISTLILLKFINELIKKAEANDRIGNFYAEDLIKDSSLYFAPLINPDGVDLVLGRIHNNSYYESVKGIAEKYSEVPFPSGWKANIHGVDLNLQYPANWEKAKEIKYKNGYIGPAPRDFVGIQPLSEPESCALANLTCKLDPDIVIALHTQGKEIYWRFNDCAPQGSYDFGMKLAEASGYLLADTPPLSDNAGYKDWFIKKFNRPGYTIEMGLGESPLPLEQFDSIYSEMEPLLATAAAGY